MGLDPDLNEAMKQATRNAVSYLAVNHGVDRATALAYLSAASDFEVTQVVDKTKGVHALIRKSDFSETTSRQNPRTTR
jgi:acetamidase/formamidase